MAEQNPQDAQTQEPTSRKLRLVNIGRRLDVNQKLDNRWMPVGEDGHIDPTARWSTFKHKIKRSYLGSVFEWTTNEDGTGLTNQTYIGVYGIAKDLAEWRAKENGDVTYDARLRLGKKATDPITEAITDLKPIYRKLHSRHDRAAFILMLTDLLDS